MEQALLLLCWGWTTQLGGCRLEKVAPCTSTHKSVPRGFTPSDGDGVWAAWVFQAQGFLQNTSSRCAGPGFQRWLGGALWLFERPVLGSSEHPPSENLHPLRSLAEPEGTKSTEHF